MVVALLALIGLSAPAASASAAPHMRPAASCADGPGPYHLEANSARSLGLTYHGAGNQVTVTPSIGDTTLECVGPDTYVLHNNAGNCIRMTDASNDYKVIEESGCNTSDTNYEWFGFDQGSGVIQFENAHFGEYLGTEHCIPGNGDGIEGVAPVTGQCINWVLGSR